VRQHNEDRLRSMPTSTTECQSVFNTFFKQYNIGAMVLI
jgi:hypothetical protein